MQELDDISLIQLGSVNWYNYSVNKKMSLLKVLLFKKG